MDKSDVCHILAETLRTKQSFIIDPMYKIGNYWEPAATQWWPRWEEKRGKYIYTYSWSTLLYSTTAAAPLSVLVNPNPGVKTMQRRISVEHDKLHSK